MTRRCFISGKHGFLPCGKGSSFSVPRWTPVENHPAMNNGMMEQGHISSHSVVRQSWDEDSRSLKMHADVFGILVVVGKHRVTTSHQVTLGKGQPEAENETCAGF
mmetsp:Transcript_89640/g.159192  ORF Transcript_89640/g.159192 Transcript_89640/m.159192 type:complete len:105 (+) Transcript_89640:47-361(+)